MIQNWNTIEKIAKLAIAARKAKDFKVAQMWERLIKKFADSCLMIEEYTVSVYHGLQYTVHHVPAVCPDAATQVMVQRLRVWDIPYHSVAVV